MSKQKSNSEDKMMDESAEKSEVMLKPNSHFFMHIAKTAGSFVNETLRDGLGEQFVEHCEAPSRLSSDGNIAVWSGHIYLAQWRSIEKKHGWETKLVTLLRDPVAQLASHILWLDHYSEPEFRGEYNQLDKGTREVVDEIAATDLSDPGDLDRFLLTLEGRGVQYLDNCQSRYFIAAANGIARHDPLHLGMRRLLLRAVEEFTIIGVGEEMKRFISDLSADLEVELDFRETKVNSAKSKRSIDLKNPMMRAVLVKRCTLDNWLYHYVRNRRDAGNS